MKISQKVFLLFESQLMFVVLYYFSVDTSLESKILFIYKNYFKRSFNLKQIENIFVQNLGNLIFLKAMKNAEKCEKHHSF